MESYNIYYLLCIIIILTVFYSIYLKNHQIEKFTILWTPYVSDYYNQPQYNNYFYQNNYMYPLF